MKRTMGLLVSLAFILAPSIAAQVPRRAVPIDKTPVLAQPAPSAPAEATLTRLDDAAPPANVVGTPTANTVALVWSAAPDAIGYMVFRSLAAAGPFDPLTPAAVADTQFTDTGVAPGTTYFYQVTASRPDGHFGTSVPVAVAVPPEGRAVLRQRPPRDLKLLTAPSTGWGFADLHTHQAGDNGFGGGLIWGDPSGPPEVALKACDPAHGPGGTWDLVGNAMTIKGYGGGLEHHTGGHPNYDGWPMWYTLTHQQMYVDWLKRAVDGGLHLLVVDAVNNKLFCSLAKRGQGRTCEDAEAIDRQIDQIKQVEQSVDNASGGPGQGWYRIVYTAQQARDVVTSGKLAVVLGIEVDQLFDCGGTCTPLQVRQRLQQAYDKGVRKLIPVHLADNGFGGSALYSPLFNINNYNLNQKFFDAFDCSDRGIGFQLGNIPPDMANLLRALGQSNLVPPPYPSGGNCNARSLQPVGSFLIHEMMSKHMIIDVAHMGLRTLEATLAITDSSDYPVVASHSSILDAVVGEGRSERALSDAVIAAIRKNGGLIGIGIGGGKRDEIASNISRIPNDCGRSSKAFAQHYLTALGQVQGEPVAFGSDLNGLEMMTAPRFGADACARDLDGPQPVATMISYPFTGYRTGVSFPQMQFGNRTFDFNNDGFAQVGMYPDLVEDLQKIGLTGTDLDPLFRSADAFVRLWEKAESKTIAPLLAIPPTLAIDVIPEAPSGTMQRLVVQAKDKETGAPKSGTVSIFVVRAAGRSTVTGATGQVLSHSPCQNRAVVPGQPTTVGGGREAETIEACGGRVTVAGYPDATFTAP
jgi:microsomal dipeptidase-like Zn-dependent dipeptidase